jgi:hypothetical protein
MKKTFIFVLLLLSLFAYKVSAAPNTGNLPENGVKVNFNENGSVKSFEGEGWIIDEQSGSLTLTKDEVVVTLNEFVFKDGEELIGFSWTIEGAIAVLWVKHGQTTDVYGEGMDGEFTTNDNKGVSNAVFLIEIIDDEDEELDDEEEQDDEDEELDDEEEQDDEDEELDEEEQDDEDEVVDDEEEQDDEDEELDEEEQDDEDEELDEEEQDDEDEVVDDEEEQDDEEEDVDDEEEQDDENEELDEEEQDDEDEVVDEEEEQDEDDEVLGDEEEDQEDEDEELDEEEEQNDEDLGEEENVEEDEVLGEEESLPDTSDASRGLGLMMGLMGLLLLVVSKKKAVA